MTRVKIDFCGAALEALGSGALFWPAERLLVVSDLHLGKSARLAAQGGALLPPYEGRETLMRLERDLEATGARRVVCLGDSFDAAGIDLLLPEEERLWIARLQAGRDWMWIEGNHDPGPVSLGGAHLAELDLGGLVLRHIAEPDARGEISGHYHPKARLVLRGGRVVSRACFLVDGARLLMPAYGAYTGGLRTDSAVLAGLMEPGARAILTGEVPLAIPMPR
ncbi:MULTISPECIES: ligase-associated DNA damage response endonuclease PdeM [unclassified Salipiger]|uniref:ligase-associated DNA damage response endonuclease PdeM n=1 Tax=unclassified Salipiger TaxID=2640570 RepID=UPI0013BAD5E8|nr:MULTISPECIES: ligase-associated DNA damage response endonuclease PdeM [unclassified Salipiger]NDV52080.1 ligase-associated DNA damage response endonuclease PdeM [Salipiger sp. PrR003]NDW33732.1 ligase-associated DNA damage response endonuclease PdeM [Salipiger sp. PrR007]